MLIILSKRYQELDANKSLLDNLKGKVVIEYPTLHVVLRKFTTDMVILGQNVNKGICCLFYIISDAVNKHILR